VSYGGAPRIEASRSEIKVNPVFDETFFTPPEGITYVHDADVAERTRKLSQSLLMFGFAGVGRPTIESIELAPKIQLLYAAPKDGVFTMVIEQENSLVVVEPGQNDLKGEVIIERLANEYPDKPISHLIVSHHHNDHAAGIRPYIAAGAALVVHETAVDFFKEQTSRSHSRVLRDALDRNPVEASIVGVAVDTPLRIEDPEVPVVIYPLEMGHVPDMVFVFVEGEDLLYGGDLYISGLARDLRSGKKRSADILPFHAAKSLDEGIRQYDLKVSSLVGSHDQQAVVYDDLINYLSD
jgi:glyoxylase-like metal-dependent hydrolase (beta-lactamase superfamily II)